jgi:protein SCO1/2
MKRLFAAMLLALATAPALAHDQALARSPSLSATPHLAPIKPAPDFTLRDPDGQTVQLAQLHGRTVLLAFVFTTCAGACPLILHQMSLLQSRLEKAGLMQGRAVLLSVTVDPARDTPEVLAGHARKFSARQGWLFLHENPDNLAPMLAAYGEWTRKLDDGDIDHPARIYLIDPEGRIREIYSLAFFDERQAAIDIQAIARESASSIGVASRHARAR